MPVISGQVAVVHFRPWYVRCLQRIVYYANIVHEQVTENRNSSGISSSIPRMSCDGSDLGYYCAELIMLELPIDPIV